MLVAVGFVFAVVVAALVSEVGRMEEAKDKEMCELLVLLVLLLLFMLLLLLLLLLVLTGDNRALLCISFHSK